MTNIVILGAGFIGTSLNNALGANCRMVSSSECDLTDFEQVRRTLRECDHDTSIVMVAAVTSKRDNSYWGFNQNILMAKNLATFLKDRPVRNVVFLSTVEVYDLGREEIIDEDFPVNPTSWYAMSKFVSEFILAWGCDVHGVPLAILRLPGVYGPGDGGGSVVGKLIKSAVGRGTIIVHGDGLSRRDFLSVQDVSQIVSREIAKPSSHIVNVATGTCCTIMEIARCIANKIPCGIETIANWQKRPGAICFDTAKLQTQIPEFVPTDIADGIQYYLEHEKNDQGTPIPDSV